MPPSDEFRLEQVLEFRRRQEERKHLELKVLSEEERRLFGQLADLRAKEDQQLLTLAERSRSGPIEPTEFDAALAYLDAIEGSIDEQIDIVAQVQAKVLESREALIDILRDKQALEHLKQRQAEAATQEEGRRESKASDDMTSARFVRRAREA